MKNIFLILLMSVTTMSIAQVDIQTNGGLNYTSILVNGLNATKYDIVFIGDGFRSTEQNTFNARVDDAVDALRSLEPYASRMCALNIYRVNVVSDESGCDHPADGTSVDTELDCRYGNPANGEAERCIRSDSPAKCYEAADYAPDYDAVFVLVNDTQWGGCAGGLVFSSISSGFSGIITHELGHKIGSLADEYDCYVCDGSDSNSSYTGSEPSRVNVTKNTNRATTKWGSLIDPATPIPTVSDVPAGVVGLWEGGLYKARDVYRPQRTCHMKTTGSAFCQVCHNEMNSILESKCSYCELNPIRPFCYLRPLDIYEIYCPWDRYRFRWPIGPLCLTCPPDIDFVKYRILLRDLKSKNAVIRVFDEEGKIMGESKIINGNIELVFEGNRFKNYTLEMVGSVGPNTTLKINPNIEILH